MLKLVAIGVWVIVVTAGATYGAVYLSSTSSESSAEDETDLGVEELKSEMTSIPVLRNGEVTGYLILQLSFAADRKVLAERKLDPLPYLKDAAFRVIFGSNDIDFRRIRSKELDQLTTAIAEEANTRIGGKLVRNVLLQELNFVKKEDIRTNWIGNGPSAE